MAKPSIIAPDGELDLACVDALRDQLSNTATRPGADLVLDLSHVSFIDSTGLGAILDAAGLVGARGGRLVIVAPRGTAASSLLTLTGLRRRLTVFESRSAAADAAADLPGDAA